MISYFDHAYAIYNEKIVFSMLLSRLVSISHILASLYTRHKQANILVHCIRLSIECNWLESSI